MAGSQGQAWSKRIAHRANSAIRRRAQQRTQNLGEQVRVFVGVEVRYGDARGLNLANLRGGFGGNFVGVHAAGDGTCGECQHAVAKVRGSRERGKLRGSKNRLAIGEHDMATDAQFRDRSCQLCSLGERRAVGHERRRSDDAARVSLNDGPVHARSVAKIVRVDDQTPHDASLAGHRDREMWRGRHRPR